MRAAARAAPTLAPPWKRGDQRRDVGQRVEAERLGGERVAGLAEAVLHAGAELGERLGLAHRLLGGALHRLAGALDGAAVLEAEAHARRGDGGGRNVVGV